MLFDHGCDSILVGTNTMISAKCLDAGDNLWALIPCVSVMSVFWFAMLEEYYKGIMLLPIGNGVTDGSIVLFWGYFSLGAWGNSWALVPIVQVWGVDLNVSKMLSIALVVS